MTVNLNLKGPVTLTSAYSDVASSYTLPADNGGSWCGTDSAACHNQSRVVHYDALYSGYYNWYTATAGTGTHSVVAGNASASICPKGWRLPTGSSGGEIQALYNKYPGTLLTGRPADWALTGIYSGIGNAFASVGAEGYYWASTANDADIAWSIYLYASQDAIPAAWARKYDGLTVRCIAR